MFTPSSKTWDTPRPHRLCDLAWTAPFYGTLMHCAGRGDVQGLYEPAVVPAKFCCWWLLCAKMATFEGTWRKKKDEIGYLAAYRLFLTCILAYLFAMIFVVIHTSIHEDDEWFASLTFVIAVFFLSSQRHLSVHLFLPHSSSTIRLLLLALPRLNTVNPKTKGCPKGPVDIMKRTPHCCALVLKSKIRGSNSCSCLRPDLFQVSGT